MGLPNVRRVSDDFKIESVPGEGTTVNVVIYTRPRSPRGRGLFNISRIAQASGKRRNGMKVKDLAEKLEYEVSCIRR